MKSYTFWEDIFRFKTSYLFISIIFIYILNTWITNNILITDSFYYSAFGNQLASYRIEQMINSTKKLQWILYLFTVLLTIIKVILICCIIYAGLLFFDVNILFNKCLKIALIAELSPVLGNSIKVAYYIFNTPKSLQNIQVFYPMSILNLLDTGQIPNFLIYPLQQLNLFEVGYWVLLSLGIRVCTGFTFKRSLMSVIFSYGSGLMLWVLLVLFFQLHFN